VGFFNQPYAVMRGDLAAMLRAPLLIGSTGNFVRPESPPHFATHFRPTPNQTLTVRAI
jgi:hypothetical protein